MKLDTLDVVVLGLGAVAALGGYRLGFLARVASWVGLAAGLTIAARLLPSVVSRLHDAQPSSRLLAASLFLLGGAFVGQAAGLVVGARLHARVPLGTLRTADRVVGAVVGLLGVFVALWLLLPSIAGVQGWPAREARHSSTAKFIDAELPRPPDALQALRGLVGDANFPKVFNALRPAPDVGPPPADSGLPPEIIRRVSAATVKVEGPACGRIQEGSGLAIGPDLILTNAHVVAGERRTSVLLPGGDGRTRPATAVAFDPNRDLAVLRVPNLGEPPLGLSTLPSARMVGRRGAVFGHPGGQDPLRISPALVNQDVDALGRDLYDAHDTRRDVLILAANLMPGDSGGALVDQGGTVLGVAFAIAPDRPGTSYALSAQEIRAVLPQVSPTAVPTGPCLSGG